MTSTVEFALLQHMEGVNDPRHICHKLYLCICVFVLVFVTAILYWHCCNIWRGSMIPVTAKSHILSLLRQWPMAMNTMEISLSSDLYNFISNIVTYLLSFYSWNRLGHPSLQYVRFLPQTSAHPCNDTQGLQWEINYGS